MKKELKVLSVTKLTGDVCRVLSNEISMLIDSAKINGVNEETKYLMAYYSNIIRFINGYNILVTFSKDKDGVVSVIKFDYESNGDVVDLTFEDGKYYIDDHKVENKPTKRRVELIEAIILPLYSDLDFKVRGLLSALHGTNSQHKINILCDKYKDVCEEIKKLYGIENAIMLKIMNGHACVITFDFKAESGKLFKITYDKYEECYYAEEV